MRINSTRRVVFFMPVVMAVALCGCGKDDSAPVITLTGADAVSIEFGTNFVDPGATVTDDQEDAVDLIVTGSVDTQALGDYTLSYDAVDEAGNAAQTVTRTVSVVDTTAPILVLNGEVRLVVPEGESFTDPGATVTDAADPGVSVVVSGAVDTDTDGTYVLTYDATDASGNVAASVERTVQVVFDGELFVVSDGADVVLMGLDVDGSLSERDRTV